MIQRDDELDKDDGDGRGEKAGNEDLLEELGAGGRGGRARAGSHSDDDGVNEE